MPIDTPYPARFEAQTVARVHVVTPRQDMRSAIHAAIHEISAALKAAGVPRAGPWFAHHHRRPTDDFDFDVCFPISQSLQKVGRVEESKIPTVEVIRTVHHGEYQGLPQAWENFMDWISANGVKTREDFFEVYTVGPQETESPDGWQTEFNVPLADDTADTEADGKK